MVSPWGMTVSIAAVPVGVPSPADIVTVGGERYPLPFSVIIIFVSVYAFRTAFAVAVFPVPGGASIVTVGAPLV